MNKTIGIIGGMGPKATCDLMEKIIGLTDAHSDQEYIRICVDCNTNIPDRTLAILHGGISPVPEIVKSGIRLQDMGANLLIMPCNTAHYFYDKLIKFFEVPLLNMLDETAKFLAGQHIEKVGVLATDGTVQSGVYKNTLNNIGIENIYPNEDEQKVIMSIIYDCVKSGQKSIKDFPLHKIINHLIDRGAEQIVLGCTELPIAFEKAGIKEKFVDPTYILAYTAIHDLGGRIIPNTLEYKKCN